LIPIVAVLLMVTGCRDSGRTKGHAANADIARVVAHAPQRKTLSLTITRPGYLKAFEKTPLHAKLEGYVGKTRKVKDKNGDQSLKELADIGETVKEGDVLAEILIPELFEEFNQEKALLTQAEAGVEQAEKSVLVAEKKEESVKAQVAEAKAGLIKAQGEYERWKAEYLRVDELAQAGSITKQVVDEKKQQYKASEAARAEAHAKVDSMSAAHAEAQAKVAKAKVDATAAAAHVEVAKAKMNRVKTLLDYTKIRAPFDGIITERHVDTGHYVRPPQAGAMPLFVVARTDIMRIFVDVPETDAPLVDVGDRAEIEVSSLNKKKLTGPVKRHANALDPVARTLKTEIDLPNKDGKLRPNMYVIVTIILEEREKVLAVRTGAVVRDGTKNYCFVVSPDKTLVRKEVTTGLVQGEYVEILSGISSDDIVVQENAAGLKEGQRVEIIKGDGA
jgi:RND family efflux transporter MFP subunit